MFGNAMYGYSWASYGWCLKAKRVTQFDRLTCEMVRSISIVFFKSHFHILFSVIGLLPRLEYSAVTVISLLPVSQTEWYKPKTHLIGQYCIWKKKHYFLCFCYQYIDLSSDYFNGKIWATEFNLLLQYSRVF